MRPLIKRGPEVIRIPRANSTAGAVSRNNEVAIGKLRDVVLLAVKIDAHANSSAMLMQDPQEFEPADTVERMCQRNRHSSVDDGDCVEHDLTAR
jgi:hypothetical protein